MVFHPQVITMQKSYTAPFYSGIKSGGLVIVNTDTDLLTDEDHKRLEDENVSLYNIDATTLALEIGKTELSTNMAMIGACMGVTKVVDLPSMEAALQDRFGKKYIASGGTATLDEAIKKKYAKKEQLLEANNNAIKKAYEMSVEWAKTSSYSPVYCEAA
jgi:pyruvate ferredoxin oxidoreductase gamma subunit